MLPYLLFLIFGSVGILYFAAPAPILKGITTMIWGTGGLDGTTAGAIVQSGRITPKNGAPIEIEDNNGFAAALVFLADGFDAELVYLYDQAKAWPSIGSTVTLNVPKFGGAAGAPVAFNCFVAADPSIDEERKREATITYRLTYRPGVTAA